MFETSRNNDKYINAEKTTSNLGLVKTSREYASWWAKGDHRERARRQWLLRRLPQDMGQTEKEKIYGKDNNSHETVMKEPTGRI